MPSIQDTAYPRFKKNISQKELRRIYTPTEEEKALCRGARRTPLTSFYFLILFKTLRRLGYFVPLQEVPGEIVRHIAKYLNNSENSIDVSSVDFPSYDVSGTRQRHMREIRNYLKIGAYDSKSKTIIEQAVLQASQTKEDLADIINVAIEELVRQRRELPAFSSLRRFAFKGRAKVNDELHEKIYNGVDSRDREKIDQLFQVREDQRLSPWNRLKEEPGKLTRGNLLEHIARYRQFVLYAIPRASFNGVPEVKIKRFAAEAKSLNAARMKALKEYKMFAIAVCFIQKRVAGILDDLTEMLIKQVRRIHRKARLKLDEIQEKNRYVVDHLIDTLQQILLARTECRSGAERDEAEQAIIGGREESLLENCQTHSAYAGNNYYPFLWKFHANQRWTLFQVLDVLELKSSTQDQSLPQALQFLMSHQRSRATMLQIIDDSNETRESSPKNLIDLSWISKRWWKFVFNTSKAGAPPTVANRRHLELCLFYHLMLGLKSGDIFVENSDRYSDYRTQLISWEEYDRLIELYGLQSGLPVETKAFMKTLKEELFQVAEKVDSAFPHNQYAAIERDEVVMKKSAKKRKPEGLKELEAIISERLKPVSILEVLAGAQKWIQWDRFFGPLSGLDAKLEDPRKHYIYTVFCYGCGVGPIMVPKI